MTTTITIYLDAAFDLSEGGYSAEDANVAAFEAAYRQAADEVSGLAGVTINIETDEQREPSDDLANDLWQDLHDCVERTRAGGWIITPSAVKATAGFLRRAMAKEAAK